MTGISSSSWISRITWVCVSYYLISEIFCPLFLGSLEFLGVFLLSRQIFLLVETLICNIGLGTILSFQIYIFLHLWFHFNVFFHFYVMAFNKIFHFFKCLFDQIFFSTDKKNSNFQTSSWNWGWSILYTLYTSFEFTSIIWEVMNKATYFSW